MKNENTKHTPGPWELSEGSSSVWGRPPFNARVKLAEVIKHSPMNGINSEANARLIAAAPELLEACESLKSCLENWVEIAGEEDHRDYDSEALEIAREAIAKATGGAS